ncbi:unnamed protein product [Moneuplotes crassus]|uniref:Uncharacterized protein n=1 Tax=Euplotes crassus TaxID=5936 RepID=A0AAD2D0Q8_EUPCR|nr:unnamed protein product [Moneuplotes crassus]
MKLILVLILTAALAGAQVLVENNNYKWTIEFGKYRDNENYTDVEIALHVPSTTQPMTNSYYSSLACVNVGTTNYQLSTTSTALEGFAFEFQCSSTCNNLDAVYSTASYYAANTGFGQTTTHVASSPALTAITPPDQVDINKGGNYTSKVVNYEITKLTPTYLKNNYFLPNQTQTWYVRCFGRFNNAASATFTAAISDLQTTLGNGKNLSIKGNSYIATTFIATAGALVASLM